MLLFWDNLPVELPFAGVRTNQMKRGCCKSDWKITGAIASFYVFINGKRLQRPICRGVGGVCYPPNLHSLCFERSKFSSMLFFRFFPCVSGDFPLMKKLVASISLNLSMEFVYVVTHAHQQEFGSDIFLSPHQESSKPAVFFYDSKGSFDLDRPIHSKQNSLGSRYVF